MSPKLIPRRLIYKSPSKTGAIFVDAVDLNDPHDLTFSPHDSNLYVSEENGDSVRSFDTSGNPLGIFGDICFSCLGNVDGVRGIAFHPVTQNLFVVSGINNEVLEFNGVNGDLIGPFGEATGTSSVRNIVFGPNGDLYMSLLGINFGDIRRYNGVTGIEGPEKPYVSGTFVGGIGDDPRPLVGNDDSPFHKYAVGGPNGGNAGNEEFEIDPAGLGGIYRSRGMAFGPGPVVIQNDPPILSFIGNQEVAEDSTLPVPLSAIDPNGDDLTFNATGTPFTSNPPFATLTDNGDGTGSILFTPGFDNAGIYSLNVTAFDNSTSPLGDFEVFTLNVTDVNRPPTISAINDVLIFENNTIVVPINATDGDGNSITLNATGIPFTANPPFANLTDNGDGTGSILFTPGFDDSGLHTVIVTATDDGVPPKDATEIFLLNVTNVNFSPILTSIGPKSVVENNILNFTVTATDADLDTLTITSNATAFPFGSINDFGNGTASLEFNPTFTDAGIYFINVDVTDGIDSDNEVFTLNVTNTNQAPILDPIGNQTTDELVELSFTATATDADTPPQSLSFSLQNQPAGAAINSTSGEFTWTPTESQDGLFTFNVTVTDGIASDFEEITVTVNEVNLSPILDPIGNQVTDKLVELSFTATATDADVPVQSLSFALNGQPAEAAINAITGVFTWTPSESQDGLHTFNVTVTDGTLSDFEEITVTVNEINVPPVLDPIANATVAENSSLLIALNSTDADGNTITLSATGLPTFATLNDNGNGTGTIDFVPGFDDAGIYPINVTATDDGIPSLFDTESFTLTVNNTNRIPVADADNNQTVNEGTLVQLNGTASFDPDNDPMTFAWNQTSGIPVTLSNVTSPTPTFTAPFDGHANITLDFELIVNDGELDSISDSVTITVNDVTPTIHTVCAVDCDFTVIQNAINVASTNDEVRISDSRQYNEALDVNVTGLLLTSDSLANPLIWSDSAGSTVDILASDWFPIGSSIGDRLTSLTVTVISSKSDSVPSVTVTLNVCNPFCASVGVHVNNPDVALIAAPVG